MSGLKLQEHGSGRNRLVRFAYGPVRPARVAAPSSAGPDAHLMWPFRCRLERISISSTSNEVAHFGFRARCSSGRVPSMPWLPAGRRDGPSGSATRGGGPVRWCVIASLLVGIHMWVGRDTDRNSGGFCPIVARGRPPRRPGWRAIRWGRVGPGRAPAGDAGAGGGWPHFSAGRSTPRAPPASKMALLRQERVRLRSTCKYFGRAFRRTPARGGPEWHSAPRGPLALRQANGVFDERRAGLSGRGPGLCARKVRLRGARAERPTPPPSLPTPVGVLRVEGKTLPRCPFPGGACASPMGPKPLGAVAPANFQRGLRFGEPSGRHVEGWPAPCRRMGETFERHHGKAECMPVRTTRAGIAGDRMAQLGGVLPGGGNQWRKSTARLP